jgi:hypothetical protein
MKKLLFYSWAIPTLMILMPVIVIKISLDHKKYMKHEPLPDYYKDYKVKWKKL